MKQLCTEQPDIIAGEFLLAHLKLLPKTFTFKGKCHTVILVKPWTDVDIYKLVVAVILRGMITLEMSTSVRGRTRITILQPN